MRSEVVKLKFSRFKYAIRKGKIEEINKAKEELKEALLQYGLEEDLVRYILSNIKRYVEIEEAYLKKLEELKKLKETIKLLCNEAFKT